MKTTSRTATLVAVAVLLLASCGDSTPSEEAQLRSILDTVADRAGMPGGSCHEECVSKALAAFDECVRQGGDRERCFGQAIHHFYRCMDECAPPTCDERCEVGARQVFEECVAAGGDPDRCAQRAREALTRCLEECEGPEPPTCEERCEARARDVFRACLEEIGDEERCRVHAEEFLGNCLEECETPPVCRSDEDCEHGESCQLEVCINTCLDDDPICIDSCIGVCVPDVCICPAIYAPVCGVDGVTYGNACEATCAGVEIAHEGECRDECRDNADCPRDLICYPPTMTCQPRCAVDCLVCDPVCGEDGMTYCCGEIEAHCNGAGVAHPGSCDCICPAVYDPVCGVDGVTYGNACEATCAGVEVAHDGECRDECEPVACEIFCEFGFKLGPDGCPICECNEPCICTEEYDPVCGVDGVTYSNACFAGCAGVEIPHEGECKRECGSNADCPDDLICYPPSKTCQPQCEIACFRYDPVCGTDGVTYGCGQEDAWCHGAEVAHEGECRDECKPVACEIFCEFGFKLGPDGCPICECNEPCICTEEYDPVCGVDGVTYGNACFAGCAAVEIAHEGECRDLCPLLVCDVSCEFGHVQDERGCPTCQCAGP